MAKPKPNLASAVDDLPPPPAPITLQRATRSRRDTAEATGQTVLVGANLEPRYARNLAMLHAETGKSKKELLQKALDMLFTSAGGPNMKL